MEAISKRDVAEIMEKRVHGEEMTRVGPLNDAREKEGGKTSCHQKWP